MVSKPLSDASSTEPLLPTSVEQHADGPALPETASQGRKARTYWVAVGLVVVAATATTIMIFALGAHDAPTEHRPDVAPQPPASGEDIYNALLQQSYQESSARSVSPLRL